MTESEFNKEADVIFEHIEHTLDSCDTDMDYDSNGVVLEIEFDNGGKLVINRHVPTQEIWLAAKSGGFHYSYLDGKWFSQREGSELYAKLSELILQSTGTALRF